MAWYGMKQKFHYGMWKKPQRNKQQSLRVMPNYSRFRAWYLPKTMNGQRKIIELPAYVPLLPGQSGVLGLFRPVNHLVPESLNDPLLFHISPNRTWEVFLFYLHRKSSKIAFLKFCPNFLRQECRISDLLISSLTQAVQIIILGVVLGIAPSNYGKVFHLSLQYSNIIKLALVCYKMLPAKEAKEHATGASVVPSMIASGLLLWFI